MTGASRLGSVPALLEADGNALGRRLFIAGSGQVAVDGAEEAYFTFDASGVTVLVIMLPEVIAGTGSQIADELDRIAWVAPAEMRSSDDASAVDEEGLVDAHASFFGTPDTAGPQLNHDQKAAVIVRERPDVEAWEELVVELGGQLAGVFLSEGGQILPLEPPGELRRTAGPRRRPGWAITAVAGLAILGVTAALTVRPWESGGTGPAAPAARSAVRDVVNGVPSGATHNQWIGQDHLVRASDGTLLAVYGTGTGLQVVADHSDQGRAWKPAATVPGIRASASSVAIDDADRLHVVFSDGSRVGYAVVQGNGERWTSSDVLEIDATTGTPYVDVAYDDASDVAHVVWIEDGPEGQAPRWAAIPDDGDGPHLAETRRLAPPAADVGVLVNVATGPDAEVVATYRRGDSPTGWFARSLAPGEGYAWGEEEEVTSGSVIGAADLVIDRSGVAHLVLRDSTRFDLAYFTRRAEGGWSEGEIVVDATATEEIDFPSLTIDRVSRLVYVFFQNGHSPRGTGVHVAVRDPARGWEPPYPVSSAAVGPDGAFLPSSIAQASGIPIVLWTAGGATAVLQVATVTP